jgi:tetratricopeptide (TPR) repeat protein
LAADRARKGADAVLPSKLDRFFEEQRNYIIGACVLMVVAAAAVFGIKWYITKQEARSTTEYMAVVSHLRSLRNKDQLDRVASNLETLADRGLAPIGYLDLGNLDYYRGDPEGAERAYRRFIAENDPDSPLAPLAYEGLGYALEAQGRFKESFENFLTASRATRKPGRTTIFSLARLSEKLEKPGDAKVYYREFLQLYPAPDVLGSIAKNRLRALGK